MIEHERKAYLSTLGGCPTARTEHLSKLEGFETSGCQERRKRVKTTEESELTGEVFMGNFWPKNVWEAKNKPRKLGKKELQFYDGQRGIFLADDVPMVPGCVRVYSAKRRKIRLETQLPVPEGREEAVYDSGAKKLDSVKVKAKECEATSGTIYKLKGDICEGGWQEVFECASDDDLSLIHI